MTVGEKIREIRKNANLTQKDLARLSGIAVITIRKYENNERNPKKEQIEKIAKALKVTSFEITKEQYDYQRKMDLSLIPTIYLLKEIERRCK